MVLDLQPLKSIERHPFLNKVNSLYFYNYLNQYVSNEGWRQGCKKGNSCGCLPIFIFDYLSIYFAYWFRKNFKNSYAINANFVLMIDIRFSYLVQGKEARNISVRVLTAFFFVFNIYTVWTRFIIPSVFKKLLQRPDKLNCRSCYSINNH